jgi:hypothetical protein
MRVFAVLLMCLFAGFAFAQSDAKLYAPENLTKLPPPDQARILTRQYAEISGGAALPQDQLEFYLEQIPRGWSFSQIKQDMVESLRTRAPIYQPPQQPGQGGWQTPGYQTQFPERGGEIQCESVKERYQECPSGFRNPAKVARQLSRTQCVEGQNWGHRPGVIWVSRGCRATFMEDVPYTTNLAQVNCQSTRGYRECPAQFQGPATLISQSGRGACVEGQTWGQRPGVIWVDRGCSGVFQEGYRASQGYYPTDQYDDVQVDCASLNSSYAICSWDARYGAPFLLEQYSISPCIEGSTWGYTAQRGLWVDRGCRARFGAQGR